jgi:hypothetical protein
MAYLKGKRVAVAAGVIGLAVLALTAFLARDRIAEEWWLWKLSRASAIKDEIKPVKRLGELRSVRAVPLLFDRLRVRGEELGNGFSEMVDAMVHIGAPAVPYLIRGLDHQDEDTRKLSFALLEKLGPQGRDAIPVLNAKVRGQDCAEADSALAVSALIRIVPSAEVIPLLTGITRDENVPKELRDFASDLIKEVEQGQDLPN